MFARQELIETMCESKSIWCVASQRSGFVAGVMNMVFAYVGSLVSRNRGILRFAIWFTLVGVTVLEPYGVVAAHEPTRTKEFVICYNPRTPTQQFARFPLVVVDYEYPPASVASLRQQGKLVFGYLSISKVHLLRGCFARF